MTKTKKKLKKVVGSILKDRQSTSTKLPQEDFGPDTLMKVVKKELVAFRNHQEAYDIRYQENPLITTVFSNTLVNLNQNKQISPSQTLETSRKVKNKKKRSRRYFSPLLKRTTQRILVRQKTATWVKSLGIPKPRRSSKIPDSRRPMTTEITGKADHVIQKPACMIPGKKSFNSTDNGSLNDIPLHLNYNGELLDFLKSSPIGTSSTEDFEDSPPSPPNITSQPGHSTFLCPTTPERKLKKSFVNLSGDHEKLLLTPGSAGKRSVNSDVEYDRMCETVQNDDFTPTNFTFEAVELLENFDEINDLVDDSVLADILGDTGSKIYGNGDEVFADPLSIDPIATTGEKSSNIRERRKSLRIQSMPSVESYKESDVESVLGFKGRRETDSDFYVRDKRFMNLDGTARTCEKLSEFHDEKEECEEPLSKEIIEKWRNVKIKLEHQVPPQHHLGRSFCISLSKEEKAQFNKLVPLKVGVFSPREDEIIKNNWKRFCELHQLDFGDKKYFFKRRYYGVSFIKGPSERRKFFQFLGNGLPCRTMFSIHKRFEKLYGFRGEERIKRQRYTKKEDQQILEYFESPKKGIRKSQVLPNLLNRPYESIQQRYYYLRNKNTIAKAEQSSVRDVDWNLPLIEEYLKNLLDITISDDIMDLKDAVIPLVVWEKLEEKMKISSQVLKYFWLHRLHMQLFCPGPIYVNELKIMLIEYLYNKGVVSPTEILWTVVVKSFDGLTKEFLSNLLLRMKQSDKNYNKISYGSDELSFGDFIEYLYETKIQQLKEKEGDSFLPRLSFTHGRIGIIDDYPINALHKE